MSLSIRAEMTPAELNRSHREDLRLIFTDGEHHDVFGAEIRDQLLRRIDGQDLASIKDRDSIAQPFGFIHVVRGEKHRAASFSEVADDLPEFSS